MLNNYCVFISVFCSLFLLLLLYFTFLDFLSSCEDGHSNQDGIQLISIDPKDTLKSVNKHSSQGRTEMADEERQKSSLEW